MLKPMISQSVRRPRQAGFTLAEMLVAVALVLLIMLLLANVFSLAASTATKQKGTAENDQQARTFTTIIQGDLCARTFRKVIPFHPLVAAPPLTFTDADGDSLELRRGYFCVSENNPNSQKDDVLSLTVDYDITTNRFLSCVDRTTFDILARSVILGTGNLFQNPNQPEADDGFPYPNKSGLSTKAEVCYFLRDGNLHRRVMLLREMYTSPGSDDGQPTGGAGAPIVTGPYPGAYSPNGSGVFWRDFDYCALYNSIDAKPWFLIGAGVDSTGAPLNSSLNNAVDGSFQFDFDGPAGPLVPVGVPLAVGIPHFRFGHNVQDARGRPREFLNAYSYNTMTGPTPATGEQRFIGRFTTQETSHTTFTYPGNLTNGNPMDPTTVMLNDTDNNGVVDSYDGLNRRGDDILLTNVIEFDVKVWDDIRNQFVDLGNSGGGQFSASRNQNPAYGNTFDTWHWRNELGVPPYWPGNRPGNVGPDGAPGAVGVDEDGDAIIDYDGSGNPDQDELGWIGTDDEVPLKAIQITIRYTDPTSGLVRQVTLLNSLLD